MKSTMKGSIEADNQLLHLEFETALLKDLP